MRYVLILGLALLMSGQCAVLADSPAAPAAAQPAMPDSLYFGPDGSVSANTPPANYQSYDSVARNHPEPVRAAAPVYNVTKYAPVFNREEIVKNMHSGRRYFRRPGESALVDDRLVRAGRKEPEDEIMKIQRVPRGGYGY